MMGREILGTDILLKLRFYTNGILLRNIPQSSALKIQ
jgi:hypothetical protein